MNLKNYTSSVPSHTTISSIEAYLIECGATGIAKEIKAGRTCSIVFQIEDERGKQRTVKLPAQVDEVWDYLWTDYVTARRRPKKTKDDFEDQAHRTAWKIMQDWVQVQMSMIKLKQATLLQVFLSYLYDGQQTYYEYLKGSHFRALPAPKEVEP